MRDRREQVRSRTFLGGTIVFNKRASILSCTVRNLTPDGAKVTLDQGVVLPDELDLTVPQRANSWRGRVVWRTGEAAGIRFVDRRPGADVVAIETARKLNKLAAENKALRQKITWLQGEE